MFMHQEVPQKPPLMQQYVGPIRQTQPRTTNNSRQGAGVHTHHRHTTSPISKQHQRDLGIFGVFLHVIGDAINNIGVIASAAAIWWGKSPARFYADPAVGMGISLMIFATSMPLSM